MLEWDELEVISALEAIPEVDYHQTRYEFQVRTDDLLLNLVIEPYTGNIYLKLYGDGIHLPFISITLINCTRIVYVKDKRGELLEFEPARMFGSEYKYGKELWVRAGIRLVARPHIMLEIF